MSKFLVTSNIVKGFLLCNHTCKFSSSVQHGKGGGKKSSTGKGNEPLLTVPIGFPKTSMTNTKTKKTNKSEADPTIIPAELLQHDSRPQNQKSNRKRLQFPNTDENGLPLLTPRDCNIRVEFASKMINLLDQDPELLSKIIFSDEGNFNLSPLPKNEGTAIKDVENMKSFHSEALQRYGESKRLPQIVWCGMTTKYIIGPYFFNAYLTDRTYIKMLRSYLIPQLRALEGGGIDSWWFQQDGNPPHRTRAALAYLKETFGPRLISYGCPLMWPPRSADLTPLDYFLWDHLKLKLEENCFPEELCTSRSFRRSLITQIEDIDQELIERVVKQFRKRLEQCIDVNGERFSFESDKEKY